MENLEGNENFFGDNDIKEKILWNGILREINRLNSTRLRENGWLVSPCPNSITAGDFLTN